MKLKDKERIELEELMIHQQILHQLQHVIDEEEVKKSDLSKILGVSRSYVSQLFHGNKFFNLNLIAKLMIHFGLKFKVQFIDREKKETSKSIYMNFEQETNAYSVSYDDKVSVIVKKVLQA